MRSVAAFALLVCVGLLAVGTAAAAGPAPQRDPAAAGEAFGLDLLGAQPPGNVVVSPDSVTTALAMAGTGARGETAKQIAATLHLTGPAGFKAVGGLQRRMIAGQAAAGEGHSAAPTLDIANGLFVQQGFPLKPDFVTGLRRHFGAAPESADFAGDPQGALASINSWGSEHTNGVIPEMLSGISDATRLVLANAVYLKAKWRHAFESSGTASDPFFKSSGKTTAKFMHKSEALPYGTGPGYAAVELPYRGSNLSMLVVLPTAIAVTPLEHQLAETGLESVVQGLAKKNVELSLPRFHLTTRVELKEGLSALGMPLAFSEAADFSGITSRESLTIGAVEHVADIDVDEEGTEAVATTTGQFVGTSKSEPVEAVTFDADHPFLFFVRDDKTGAILFAGRLVNPATAAPE